MRTTYLLSFMFFSLIQGTHSCSCYSFHADLNPWHHSRQHCLNNGGDLVSLETEEEWSYINDEIQKRRDTVEWHIGLTNLTGTWKWLSNRTLTIEKWQEGEPEKVEYKRFVTMAKNWPIGTRGLFNSLRGDIRRARICEYRKGCKQKHLGCKVFMNTFQSTVPVTISPVSTRGIKVRPSASVHPNKNIELWASPTPTNSTSTNLMKTNSYYLVVIPIVLGAIFIGVGCIVCVALSVRRKKSERRKDQECKSPRIHKVENNTNGFEKVKVLIESSDEEGNEEGATSKGESSGDDDSEHYNEMGSQSLSPDTSGFKGESNEQVPRNGKNLMGITEETNSCVNGVENNKNTNSIVIIKSEAVSPTKEAQFASIVVVPTNHTYSGKAPKQTLMTTFAPIYQDNVQNFAHKEYPVYAAINSCRSAAQSSSVKMTSPRKELNYAELAEFDCNAWHYTKKPPPYEETKYATVQDSNEPR